MGRMRHTQGQVKFHEGTKAKNPVVFTYGLLNHTPQFDKHLGAIYHAKGIPASAAGKLLQILELVTRHDRNMQKMAHLIIEKYAVKDADGKPKGWKEAKFEFAKPEDETAHDKEMGELFDTKVVLPLERIPLAHLEFAALPAATLRALDFIILGLPKIGELAGAELPEGYVAVKANGEPSDCKPDEDGSIPSIASPKESAIGAIAP